MAVTASESNSALPPPGPTTLNAMLLAADAEMRRSEGSLLLWRDVGPGAEAWVAYHQARRNAFARMVRLIERICSDADLYERVRSL